MIGDQLADVMEYARQTTPPLQFEPAQQRGVWRCRRGVCIAELEEDLDGYVTRVTYTAPPGPMAGTLFAMSTMLELKNDRAAMEEARRWSTRVLSGWSERAEAGGQLDEAIELRGVRIRLQSLDVLVVMTWELVSA